MARSSSLQHVTWRQGGLSGTWPEACFEGDLLRVRATQDLELQRPVQLRLMLEGGEWLSTIAVLAEDSPAGELHMTLALDPAQRDKLLRGPPCPAAAQPPPPDKRDPVALTAGVLLGVSVAVAGIAALLVLR